ncbi:hypothetical protein B566_EDAN008274 [Ephemera danica]|nr:hypothetical protein B566_EDAN008274 [Ephemera danica]
MVIVGQFNMAFIVTQLEDHIFIIDQHAADEKYNYEMLLKDAMTDTRSQRLIVPLVLNLNLTQEILFLEYAQVFRDAGFLFTIDNEAEVSKKVRITAVPTFLHEEFQIADIIDMLSQLQETPYIKPQPSRMKSLLASRACRSSVMVGHTLDMAAMRRLVDNMATMEHPWNCPHGRPTMRHLTGFTWELVDD